MRASLPFASSPEHCLPRIQFLFIGSRLCSNLLSDLASQLGPCASLSLHLHLVVKRTCTSKLSIMLGTQNEERRSFGLRSKKLRGTLARAPAGVCELERKPQAEAELSLIVLGARDFEEMSAVDVVVGVVHAWIKEMR